MDDKSIKLQGNSLSEQGRTFAIFVENSTTLHSHENLSKADFIHIVLQWNFPQRATSLTFHNADMEIIVCEWLSVSIFKVFSKQDVWTSPKSPDCFCHRWHGCLLLKIVRKMRKLLKMCSKECRNPRKTLIRVCEKYSFHLAWIVKYQMIQMLHFEISRAKWTKFSNWKYCF